MTTDYLQTTPILDFSHPDIVALVNQRGWRELSAQQATSAIYDFVKDEIKFGYNADDAIPASTVLNDGYGQCNTKGSLLMALLRAVGIECRFHGFTIYNALQRGAIPNYIMPIAPKRILHSWVEVKLEGQWINLEGFIIDAAFLSQVQSVYINCKNFSGYGIAVKNLARPNNEFDGDSTYIQAEGIADDFGVFNSPDLFFAKHGSNLKGFKKFIYRHALRHLINRHVSNIRKVGIVL